jgi:WhiB family redox-sensing transcriptional regulator
VRSDLSWFDRIACAGMDTELFFPARGRKIQAAHAKAVCERCPVRVQCEEFRQGAQSGIWGGKSDRDRRNERGAA